MAKEKDGEEGKAADKPVEGQASDPRHDARLTVVGVYASRCALHDIVEAVATVPGPAPGIRRFKFMLDGVHDVAFGWLIGLVDSRHVLLYWHESEAGVAARLRAKVQELQPIDN